MLKTLKRARNCPARVIDYLFASLLKAITHSGFGQ